VSRNFFGARFGWLRALPLLAVVFGLFVIALGTLTEGRAGSNPGKEALFDLYQRLKPSSAPVNLAFHVVSIDRESIEKIGPWPWPRTILADIADRAAASGAKGVVLVEPVDSPDPLSPATIGDFWLSGARDEDLARQLSLLPNTDEALARALKGDPSAVAIAEGRNLSTDALRLQRADTKKAAWLKIKGGGEFLALPGAKERSPVNRQLADAAELAVGALETDADGVVRRIAPLWAVGGIATPSLSLAAARMAEDGAEVTTTPDASAASAAGLSPRSLTIGGRTTPLSRDGDMRLHLPRQLRTPETPAWKLLERSASNSQLKDKVVFIGRDVEQGRRVETAKGPISITKAHALAAEQLLSGGGLLRPNWAAYAEAIAVILLGAGAIMWSQRLDFWKAIGIAALATALLYALSFGAFAVSDLLLNPAPAALALFLGAFSVAGGRSLGVVLQDNTVRGSFQGSLPEPTMKKLREEGATEILDGDYRPLTVLALELRFADDDLARLAAAPDDATKIIASACLDLRKTIIDTGGAADQAEGGKMFAYYNAPLENQDHMNAACSSALRLIESMDKINAGIETSPKTRGVALHLAIGIASSECFVGPMGHGRNNRYSAIGPAVDIAVYLRRQAEYYGPAVICDEAIHRKLNGSFAFLELDRIRTNKSDRPQTIHALIGNPFLKSSKGFRLLDDAHRQMLAAYRAGDFATARQWLDKARTSPGAKIPLFDIYDDRIRRMQDQGPLPADWDGAHEVVI
jgi:adenylate cyclase